MAFTNVLADDRSIYAVTGDGALLWYRDTLRDGSNGPNATRGWAPRSGSRIGAGWQGFRHVFSGGNGVIYAIAPDGRLIWYRDLLRDGTNGAGAEHGWAARSGSQIGAGWDGFRHVFSGGNGVIYAIAPDGGLFWYRDLLRDGTNGAGAERGWGARSGSRIGEGWQIFTRVFAGGNGVIYAFPADGRIRWYRDDTRDGTAGWAPGSGNQIGLGWQGYVAVFSPGDGSGIMYAISSFGDLEWYRDDLRNGTNGAGADRGWAANSGTQIGLGWAMHGSTDVEGYPVPGSVAPGDPVEVKFRAAEPGQALLQVFRLRETADGSVGVPVAVAAPVAVDQRVVPVDAWQNGCDWPTTATVLTDPSWPSGLYSARCTLASGQAYDAVFVIRPPARPPAQPPVADFLVVASTNCWNAYNAWGGRSNYSVPNSICTLSFERPNPEAVPDVHDNGSYQLNHLAAAEIWILTWLEDNGFRVDVCSDLDFHRGEPDPGAYKGVILSTHPEYWSLPAAERLAGYVAAGGNLLYLGGNGVFRSVEFAPDGRSMTTANLTSWQSGNAWADGPKPRTLLGVAYDVGSDTLYPQRCGYVVEQADHPFFTGTGLTGGDVFGRDGRNGGGACGWEVDTVLDFDEGNGPPPDGVQILARGELIGGNDYCGHMTYHEVPGGGFVLSIASITFGGALVVDAVLQQVTRNALAACLVSVPV